MSLRARGKRNRKYPHALPVASVDTKEEAQALLVLTCRAAYDDRMLLSEWVGWERNNVECLPAVSAKLEELYQQMKARRAERQTAR